MVRVINLFSLEGHRFLQYTPRNRSLLHNWESLLFRGECGWAKLTPPCGREHQRVLRVCQVFEGCAALIYLYWVSGWERRDVHGCPLVSLEALKCLSHSGSPTAATNTFIPSADLHYQNNTITHHPVLPPSQPTSTPSVSTNTFLYQPLLILLRYHNMPLLSSTSFITRNSLRPVDTFLLYEVNRDTGALR